MSPLIKQYVEPNGFHYFLFGAFILVCILALSRYNKRSHYGILHAAPIRNNVTNDKTGVESVPGKASSSAIIQTENATKSQPSALQLHLKSLYEGLPRPDYIDHGSVLRVSPPALWFQRGQLEIRLLQEARIWGVKEDLHETEGSKSQKQSRRKAHEIAEAYVGLHWEHQVYGAPWQVYEDKINRWVRELLSMGIIREVDTLDGRKRAEIIGLDDIEISGPEYLADLRTFRNEINARKSFWREKLWGKKIVLSSDSRVKSSKTISFEELPRGIENCTIAAHNTPRVPSDYQFCPHRLGLRLDKRDRVVQVEIG